MWTPQWFNLEAALQTNGVAESDVKEVMKKQFENIPKRIDNEKTNGANDRINTTNFDLTFSRMKLSLKLSLKLLV